MFISFNVWDKKTFKADNEDEEEDADADADAGSI